MLQSTDEFAPRLLLAHRIAELPGAKVVDIDNNGGPFTVQVYLTPGAEKNAGASSDRLFAQISHDGIVVNGLQNSDKHQVLSRGWGKLRKRAVVLYMPRNLQELEICWEILQRAFYRLSESGENASLPVFVADFPRPLPLSLH